MENTETRKNRKYDRDFRISAVKLVIEEGRRVREVADNLGIHENLLRKWREKYLLDPSNAFPGKGHMKPADEELYKLRKELANVTMERDILKKAMGVMSRMSK
jgi:transposase